ncbi:MAG: hypothetical protein Q9Q13_13155 [Acidobacteriota bacterium]|nr:hypothetical protein [Acidobacteriota bacterium]
MDATELLFTHLSAEVRGARQRLLAEAIRASGSRARIRFAEDGLVLAWDEDAGGG